MSQFGTFSSCGEQYRLEKVARAPRTPAAWFIQGTAFHAAVELWEQTGRQAAIADLHTRYHESWDEEFAKSLEKAPVEKWMTGGRTLPANDVAMRKERGWNQVKGYVDYALGESETWRILDLGADEKAVELEFNLELEGVTVLGFIDQVIEWRDGRITTRDLKTGTKLPAWPFQLAVYDIAIADEFGINRPLWGDYYMAKNSGPTSMYSLTRYTKDVVTSWFQQMDTAEKMGVYLPNPGDSCRTCGVSDFCLVNGGMAEQYAPSVTELNTPTLTTQKEED